MKRPALLVGFPFVLGLVLASCFAFRFWLPVAGGVTLAAAAVLLWRRDLWKYVLLGTLSCLTACCVYWQKEAATFWQQINFAGQETTFTGQITDVNAYKNGYVRYYLDGELSGGIPARVELFCDDLNFQYEETLTVSGTPELLTSGYLYDSAGYARSKGVFLTFFMPEISSSIPQGHPSLRSILYNWRMRMTQRIQTMMGEESGALLIGMLFGDKSGMSRSSKTLLYRMGVGHVLAVSGLHLDFIAACLSWLLQKLHCGRKLRFALVAVLCGLFVICAGETVSVKRAFIMILLREGAALVFRTADPLNSLSIAMFLLGLENPFVIHSAAFWLSCTAAWGIGVLAPYMTKEMPMETFWQKQKRNFLMFCWAFAALLPVSAYYFREVSLISPVSNTLLVPVCMLSLLLGMIAVLFGASGFAAELLLGVADVLNSDILWISDKVGRIPWTHAATGSALLLPLLGAGVLLVAFCHILGKNRKLTARTVLLALFVTGITVGTEHYFWKQKLHIAVLGAGEDCVLVLAAEDEAVVADMTGASSLASYAEYYLSENGIQTVDTLYFCKPSERSKARYHEYLALLPPERTVSLKDTYREQLFHGAKLSAQADMLTVEYAGMTFVCTKDAQLVETEPEVLVVLGDTEETLPDCGILILPDAESPYLADKHTYIGENELELTLTKDGTCRVRRLYGGT